MWSAAVHRRFSPLPALQRCGACPGFPGTPFSRMAFMACASPGCAIRDEPANREIGVPRKGSAPDGAPAGSA